MEMRVNQIQQPASVEQVQNTAPTDGSFKFMLASHVEEAELQERLTNLMAEITTEGEKLAKKRDVKDMRHYRGLVKEFLNEVVTRSHSFSRVVFPASIPTTISILKINVGMSWVGVIVGEFLVSKAGLGYLIVYGGQVFKLDLVMGGVLILCVLAALMYYLVAILEKVITKWIGE